MTSVPVTPTSPKVKAAAIAAVAVAILLPGLLGAIAWLQGPDGSAWLGNLPPIVVAFIGPVLTGIAAVVAAYLRGDPLRWMGEQVLNAPGFDPNVPVEEQINPEGGVGLDSVELDPRDVADGPQVGG